MGSLALSSILVAFTCSGPYCGPDTDFERPAGAATSQAAPSILLLEDGACVVAWESRPESGGSRILLNRRDSGAGGLWLTEPVRLGTAREGNALEVRLAVGAAPLVYAVWQSDQAGTHDIYFVRSTDAGFTWTARERRINSIEAGASTSSLAALAADENGRVYVAWEDLRNGSRDIYFVRSIDGGATWEKDGRLDTDAPGSGVSYHPQLAVWDDGTVLAGWWDERNGSSDLYVRRSTDAGATWGAAETRLDPGEPGAAASRSVRIAVEQDRVAFVWDESAVDGANVVTRVSEDRGATWGPVSAVGWGSGPALTMDGDDRPAVAWVQIPPSTSREKTSIGGEIVPLPVQGTVWIGRPAGEKEAERQRLASQLYGPTVLWMEASGDRVWIARTGTSGKIGIIDVFRSRESPGRSVTWENALLLRFGNDLNPEQVGVTPHALAGAVEPDGSLHLVWAADWGERSELGYYRLPGQLPLAATGVESTR